MMVAFDFEMDTFVSVQAPEGTDPDTLVQQALAQFAQRIAEGEAQVINFQSFPVIEV
jgi:hypothetical protein